MDNPRLPGSAFPAVRRVFTAPTSLATQKQPSSTTNGLVETLYHHPNVKIVSFTAGPRPTFGPTSAIEVEPGSLSWTSQMERTIAVGPFRIYRAPGSVAFLNCGSALQPILPKSQCWCVDEDSSRYVLQIRRPQYWRIEVPTADDHDVRLALELREVLGTILQFEKTECPFRRSFTVELPERPSTPVKKRPWTPPVRQSMPSIPITPLDPEEPKSVLQKEDASIANDKGGPEVEEPLLASVAMPAEDAVEQPMDQPSEKQEDEIALIRKVDAAVSVLEQNVRKACEEKVAHDLLRPNGFQASRSVTAPPQLTLVTPPPSATLSSPVVAERAADQSNIHSRTESQDSFHSTEAGSSPHTPLPLSPPLTAEGSPHVKLCPENIILVQQTRQHTQSDHITIPNTPAKSISDSSEVTLVNEDLSSRRTSAANSTVMSTSADNDLEAVKLPETIVQEDESTVSNDETPITKILTSSSSSTATYASATSSTSPVLSRRPYMRHRPTTSSSISPSRASGLPRLPSAANLFSSYRNSQSQNGQPTKLSLVKRLPMAVIQKTVEILFSPPSHLIALMLKVAARITAGEWSGYVFGFGEQGERIPVRWDWSDEDDDGEGELGGWHADEDWGFGRRHHAAAVTPLKMAGAFPESPEESGYGDDDGHQRGRDLNSSSSDMRDESPSTAKGTRRKVEDDGQKHGKHWSGSWSVD